MNSVETQVGTVQNTLQKVGVRTRAINKTLSEVEVIEMGPTKAIPLFDPNMEVEEESEDRPTNISDSVTVDFEEDLD